MQILTLGCTQQNLKRSIDAGNQTNIHWINTEEKSTITKQVRLQEK